jgi:hypothetical protein
LALGLLTGCPDDEDDEEADAGVQMDVEEDDVEMQPADTGEEADAEMMADTDAMAEDDAMGDADGGQATANLQIIHASPDPNAAVVDVYVNDEMILDDFEFMTATEFLPVAADTDLQVAIAPPDSESADDSIYEQTVNLPEDATRVAIASGVLSPGDFQGMDNEFALRAGEAAMEAQEGEVDVNIFHGSPDATEELGGGVTVATAEGTALVEDLAFGEFSGITGLAAEAYTLEIQSAEEGTTAASFAVDASGLEGAYVTVVAIGFVTPEDPDPADGEPFGLVAFDANGDAIEFSAPQ